MFFAAYEIVSQWWLMECTEDNPGDAGILPRPMLCAGKDPDEIGLWTIAEIGWVHGRYLLEWVKMTEAIMGQ